MKSYYSKDRICICMWPRVLSNELRPLESWPYKYNRFDHVFYPHCPNLLGRIHPLHVRVEKCDWDRLLSHLCIWILLERNTQREREKTGSAKGNQLDDVHFVLSEEAWRSRSNVIHSIKSMITCHVTGGAAYWVVWHNQVGDGFHYKLSL